MVERLTSNTSWWERRRLIRDRRINWELLWPWTKSLN